MINVPGREVAPTSREEERDGLFFNRVAPRLLGSATMGRLIKITPLKSARRSCDEVKERRRGMRERRIDAGQSSRVRALTDGRVSLLPAVRQVLITKLRSANSAETQQYRKGSKALLVLIPLLGLTYVLVIAGPTEGIVAVYFSHVRAVLLSTQVRRRRIQFRRTPALNGDRRHVSPRAIDRSNKRIAE